MAQDSKTTLDGIDWDKIADALLDTFNTANHWRTEAYGAEARTQQAELAVQAALALTQVSAEYRAQRDTAERDNFKIAKP